MSIEIRPVAVQNIIAFKGSEFAEIVEQCKDARTAISHFTAETQLAGQGWKAAKDHFQKYDLLLYAMIRYCELVGPDDNKYSSTLYNYFGNSAVVSETQWLQYFNYWGGEATKWLDKRDALFSSKSPLYGYYTNQYDSCMANRRYASNMLYKIRNFDNDTAHYYSNTSQIDELRTILLKATFAISGAKLGENGIWAAPTTDWKTLLKNYFGGKGTTKEDFINPDGTLAEEKITEMFDKPMTLWSPDDYGAMYKTFEDVCERAVAYPDSQPEFLEQFLNFGYEEVGRESVLQHSNHPEWGASYLATVTFDQREGFSEFLQSIVTEIEMKGQSTYNAGLDPSEYLMVGTCYELHNYGQTLTYSCPETDIVKYTISNPGIDVQTFWPESDGSNPEQSVVSVITFDKDIFHQTVSGFAVASDTTGIGYAFADMTQYLGDLNYVAPPNVGEEIAFTLTEDVFNLVLGHCLDDAENLTELTVDVASIVVDVVLDGEETIGDLSQEATAANQSNSAWASAVNLSFGQADAHTLRVEHGCIVATLDEKSLNNPTIIAAGYYDQDTYQGSLAIRETYTSHAKQLGLSVDEKGFSQEYTLHDWTKDCDLVYIENGEKVLDSDRFSNGGYCKTIGMENKQEYEGMCLPCERDAIIAKQRQDETLIG